MFLRNHDELTLEMVTDEERDYMYRVYAQRSAGADQPRHPPPARAADGQRPPPDRADERACSSRCPARRSSTTATRSAWATTSTSATATACARRCSGAPTATPASPSANPQKLYSAGHHRPGVSLRGAQRRRAAEQPALAALVDEAHHRPAAAVSRVRPRDAALPAAGERPSARVRPRARGRAHPRGRQPLALRPGGGARSRRRSRA